MLAKSCTLLGGMRNVEDVILKMYFEEQKKPVEISKELQIPKYKITRVLQKDERYQTEKEARKENNRIKHIENTKKIIKEQRSQKQFKDKQSDLILKHIHNQAARELSEPRKLLNMSYRNWNISAYGYNEQLKRFEFKKELGRSYDVPKYIKVEV